MVTTTASMCSASYCSLDLGALIVHYLKLENMLLVSLFLNIDSMPKPFEHLLKYDVSLDSLGPEYGEGCILNLEATWEESEPRTPLICILSIGSDPSAQISALAKYKEIGKV